MELNIKVVSNEITIELGGIRKKFYAWAGVIYDHLGNPPSMEVRNQCVTGDSPHEVIVKLLKAYKDDLQ